MPINNHSSLSQQGQIRTAGAAETQASSGAQVNPLDELTSLLGTKLAELSQRRPLPKDEMPPIQDKHAHLFVIPADDEATPAMNKITTYVNTMLAAKEHLSTMTDDMPAKAPLATMLGKHSKLFEQLNDVATLARFSHDEGQQVEHELGSDLLVHAAQQAMRGYLSESLSTDTLRGESGAINHIKRGREAACASKTTAASVKEQWPTDIMPLTMLMRLEQTDFKRHAPIGNISPLVHHLSLVYSENDTRDYMIANAQSMPREEIERASFAFEHHGVPLTESEKKNGLSRQSIENMLQIRVIEADAQLESPNGTALRKLSYEVARYAPELVIQERGNTSSVDEAWAIEKQGDCIELLKLSLDPEDPDIGDKKYIIGHLYKALNDFKINTASSLAENIVNSFLDSAGDLSVFKDINQFVSDGQDTNSQPATGKSSQSKKKKKGKLLSKLTSKKPADTAPSQNTRKATRAEKSNQLFARLENFLNKKLQMPPLSDEEECYGRLITSWLPCTFRSVEASVHYHQRKHSPVDDEISYMAEAQEYMGKELDERPPNSFEYQAGKMDRRSSDGEFIRLLLDPGDYQWKIATFHSPRFTDQGHEPDGIAKLKDGQQARAYEAQTPEPMSAIEQSLRQASIG